MHLYTVKSNASRAARALAAKSGQVCQVEQASDGRYFLAQAEKLAPVVAPAPEIPAKTGRARALIIAACGRPRGASAAELYAATGWVKTNWNHHLKLAGQAVGWTPEARKVEGLTRYFLTAP